MIYYIQAAIGGPVKIGYTGRTPHERLRDFQLGCPFTLRVLASEEGDRPREQELHAEFAADRLHGEWFRPSQKLRERCHALRVRVAVEDPLVIPFTLRRMPPGVHWPLARKIIEVIAGPQRPGAVHLNNGRTWTLSELQDEIEAQLEVSRPTASRLLRCLRALCEAGWAEEHIRPSEYKSSLGMPEFAERRWCLIGLQPLGEA